MQGYVRFMVFRHKDCNDVMSDDKLQLTTSDYNSEAANEYAYEAWQPPSCTAAEAESIEMPATYSSSGDRLFCDDYSFGLPATPNMTQTGSDARAPYDENVERHDSASTHGATSLPDGNQQQQQQQQQPRRPRRAIRRHPQPTSTDDDTDTPRWMSCTPKQWAIVGIVLIVKVTFIIFIIAKFGSPGRSGY